MSTTYTPEHRPQPHSWGCQHYALYCLTGDARVLEFAEECSTQWFIRRAGDLGHHLFPLWTDAVGRHYPKTGWWQGGLSLEIALAVLAELPRVSLILNVKSADQPGFYHAVAMVVSFKEGLPITILDPAREGPIEYESLFVFERTSPYRKAHAIYCLKGNDPRQYLSAPGPELGFVTEAERQTYLAERNRAV